MHYYSKYPEGRYRTYKFQVNIRGVSLVIHSASGVFSAKKLDKGTEVLIKHMIIEDGWRILDLGCGYGVVGLVAAKLAPRGRVILTDINKRAVALARKNIVLNGVFNAEVRWGDLYEPIRGELFNTIISNPPQAAGMKIIKRIIYEAPEHLLHDGLIQLVARHRKGGERIFKLLREVFPETRIVGGAAGYRVYVGFKTTD
ncbi:MAG: class I SAM-dependent methyltransferase [Thermoproteales archaeon]|nr:class I SAM-dependent methyltransferase [Thermoproteales archaeon]